MASFVKEKLALTSAGLVLAVSAAVFGTMSWRAARAPRTPVAQVQLADTPYVPAAADAPAVKTDVWNQPVAQTRGRDWVYDTFTPPEIFYNPRSRHFTVKPPLGAADDVPEEAFGLEVVAVKPEPFRLQLIGYVGGDGDWRGTFQNVASGEVFLAAAGRRVASLALSIKQLSIDIVDVKVPESMTTRQKIATAVVHDERSGKDVILTHRERRFTGGWAVFVSQAGESAVREVREGESFKLGDATYRIEKIQLNPPSVEITKDAPTLSQPDRRTLNPREADDYVAPAETARN